VLNRERACLQPAIGDQARLQNEKKRRQNQIGENDGGEPEQELCRIVTHRHVHNQTLALQETSVAGSAISMASITAKLYTKFVRQDNSAVWATMFCTARDFVSREIGPVN
jgi:hypothetical protein